MREKKKKKIVTMINIEQSEASDQEEAELMEVESNEDEWEDVEEKE